MAGKLQEISPAELKTLLDQGQITVVDVREHDEYRRDHIPHSKSLPLSNFDVEAIQEITGPFVLVCRSGNRSKQAAQQLLNHGFGSVTHLNGGILAWEQAGYPVQINKKAPISIMRQVQIIAGSLVLIGTILGAFVSPGFLFLSGFVGAGLLFAGASGTCAMAVLLGKLPYNQMD